MAAIARMDPAKNDLHPIPLRCLLCPKQPCFSDVSHLLTHISSKSHLSHRFKIEIRSQKDNGARETLARYDDWYEVYGIQQLLAERMVAKDKKKAAKRANVPGGSGPAIKRDTGTDSFPQRPTLAHWNTSPDNGSFHVHGTGQEYTLDHAYQRNGHRQAPVPYGQPGSPIALPQLKQEFWPEVGTPGSAIPSENTTEVTNDYENDRSKLKGTFWPGMSVFDSATEDQKRKRNQRKDESVLRLMQQTSAIVEPTEIVWSEDGMLRRTRDIYATPSLEGSPEPEAKDKVKKKGPRRGAATATISHTRQTRASTRKARGKESHKGNANRGGIRDEEEIKEEDLDQPPHIAGIDEYDIFNDAREPSPGQPDSFLHYGSPGLAGSMIERPDSPRDVPSFEPPRRQALHPMSSNIPLHPHSPTPNSMKTPSLSYFHGGANAHIPSFYHSQSMASSTFNPLSIQSRASFPYNPFMSHSFGGDIKSPASDFQPINANNGVAYNAFSVPGDDNPYSSSLGHRDTGDYGI